MNQILLTENYNDKKKNKDNKYKSNNSGDMKKLIIFLGIAILVFGIAIASVYGYKVYKSKKVEVKVAAKPELSLQTTEDTVTIIAKSEIEISKVIYSWNDEEAEEVTVSGKNYEKMLEIPDGENKLKVKVIDQSGQESETSQSFTHINTDIKPTIETAIVENAKLKITAKDETGMSYITYKWNDEEEKKVEVENDGDTKLEITIDVKRGKNTLTITAVNSNNSSETIDKIFNGVNNPEIKVQKEGNKLYMRISHDMGLKKVEFSVNGQDYVYDENYPEYDSTQKELEYYFELKEGENTVIITATSMEDTEEVYRGKCNYTAEQ